MKNKLFISAVRKIWTTKKKFISLLCLSLLGVGFFAGIKATSPDMLKTLDHYLDQNQVYDIEIKSTAGLTDSDIKAIQDLNVASLVVGNKSLDVLIHLSNKEEVARIISLEDINKVILTEGHMPSKPDEIVVEQRFLKNYQLKLNDIIDINHPQLSTKNLRIVGIVESPLYFTASRGTTNIGSGEWNYYFYGMQELFQFDYYTSIYMVLHDTRQFMTNSDSYQAEVMSGIDKLESIQEEREKKRAQELMMAGDIHQTSQTNFQPTWYILDRENNQAYKTFIDATKSIAQIGSVFPIIFFVVAVLISLISMSRMIEEERGEIGTLKGLGFSNWHIYLKNFCYAFLATTLGGILGSLIGFCFIPTVIWNVYTALFQIPTFISEFNFKYAIIGFLCSLFCICGASLITSFLMLKEKPSDLMRPKAPKSGKKIFIERFRFWNRISFSFKISIRNIVRYKKRIIVTIIGLAGSTALMLVGFGVKDAVTDVVDRHFHHVFIYDRMIALKQNTDIEALNTLLKSNESIQKMVEGHYEAKELYYEKKESQNVNLIVPKNKEELGDVIRLNDGKKVEIKKNKIVISEKLAHIWNIKVGDSVSFLVDGKYQKLEVSNIVENYVGHYVYLEKETYEKVFGDYETNVIFVKHSEDYDPQFDREIVTHSSVSNLVTQEISASAVSDILNSLNSVVIILIVASSMLAFVILYNLSSINISERKREISTLKVLGFYDEEVDAYITNENYFITIIGIAVGLFAGLYLCHYVIHTCEPDTIMFVRHIKPISYVITAIISVIFTIIVSKITHFNLKKIDMIESLKSNE